MGDLLPGLSLRRLQTNGCRCSCGAKKAFGPCESVAAAYGMCPPRPSTQSCAT